MTIVWVLLATLVAFGAVVVGILVWARGRVKAQASRDAQVNSRQTYLNLAAQAASDTSGRSLVQLLNALDTAPADCPVTVQWVRHLAVNKPPAMLVKITWDGNEWRRVNEWDGFRAQMQAMAAEEPTGATVKRLLADLEVTP